MRLVPGVKAIVLFGSRARGDYHPNSDWDLGVITSRKRRCLDDPSLFAHTEKSGHDVQWVQITEKALRENACGIGSFERAVVRDGQVIAGKWNRQELTLGKPYMHTDNFLRHVNAARDHLRSCLERYGRLINEHDYAEDEITDCAFFISRTADAAERLSKAILVSLHIDPRETHNISSLGNQAHQAGHKEEAELLYAMNGDTHKDHVITYNAPITPSKCLKAAKRLEATMLAYNKVVLSLPVEITNEDRQKQLEYGCNLFRSTYNKLSAVALPGAGAKSKNVQALIHRKDPLESTAYEVYDSLSSHIEMHSSHLDRDL